VSPLVLTAAGLCGLVLGVVPLSLAAVLRARALAEGARRQAREAREVQSSEIEALGRRLEALAARLDDVRTAAPFAVMPPERGGLNLSRRSQALRLHRRGEPAGRIAAELRIPVQEVQLLIKVHEIVMNAVP